MLVGAFVHAQDGVDFSGRWILKSPSDTLVFESGRYTGQRPETGVWTERREAWSLDSDGRLHVVITTRGSSDAPRTVAVVYQRD